MERLRNYSACYYLGFENNKRMWECKHDIDTFEDAEIFLEDKRYPIVIAKNYSDDSENIKKFNARIAILKEMNEYNISDDSENIKNFNARIAILKEMHEYNISNFFKKDEIIVRK